MKAEIHYLNTDLELVSPHDLTELTRVLESAGLLNIYSFTDEKDEWRAGLESGGECRDPESTIGSLLDTIELLDPVFRQRWNGCTTRELNIGYECGDTPRSFEQGISSGTLARMVAMGLSLRTTLYPAASERVSGQTAPDGA